MSWYDGAHGLADRVERVDLVDVLLSALVTHLLVVLAQLEHEAEQSTLGLVADLLRQVALVLRRLHTHTHTHTQHDTCDTP